MALKFTTSRTVTGRGGDPGDRAERNIDNAAGTAFAQGSGGAGSWEGTWGTYYTEEGGENGKPVPVVPASDFADGPSLMTGRWSASFGLDYGTKPSLDSPKQEDEDSTGQDPSEWLRQMNCCATTDRRDNAGGPPANATGNKWTGVDDTEVGQIINDALAETGGDVKQSDANLMGLREQRRNFFDENLATADDFLFAFIVAQHQGEASANVLVLLYEVGKLLGLVKGFGPGPPSPASWAQWNWMRQGAAWGAALPKQ